MGEMKMSGKKRREQIYNSIVKWILKKGYPPSMRELQKMVGLYSISSIEYHLRALKEQGRINYVDKQNRTITVDCLEIVRKDKEC